MAVMHFIAFYEGGDNKGGTRVQIVTWKIQM